MNRLLLQLSAIDVIERDDEHWFAIENVYALVADGLVTTKRWIQLASNGL